MKKKWKWPGYYIPGNRKIFLVMRFCLVFVFFCAFNVMAGSVRSQERLSLNLKNVSLMTLFQEMQKQAGVDFVYNEEQCRNFGKVSIEITEGTIEQILQQIFMSGNLTFRYENGVIMVKALEPDLPQVKKQIVKGKVTDPEGNPLPGVAIIIKGTSVGGTTDVNGKYELTLPEMKNTVLVYTFIGMKSSEAIYNGQSELNVVLKPQATEMDEVVVTGIFERKTESFTGSASTYKTEDLKRMGAQNILQSLRTLDPAFHITPNNEFGSDPNKLPDIDIRGKSSVVNLREEYETDPNQPLFILDGFEVPLQTIVDLNMERDRKSVV